MSGRTFGFQASYDDVFKLLLPDIGQSERAKAVGVADSMNQQLEEFLNRFAVTATNDKGDLVFDAAGSYTFEGDVTLDGDVTYTGTLTGSGGTIRTSDGNPRIVMDEESTVPWVSGNWPAIKFYTDDTDVDLPAYIGASSVGGVHFAFFYAPEESPGGGTAVLTLQSGGDASIGPSQAGTELSLQQANVDLVNGSLTFGTDDGLESVTGSYGSVQTQGSGAGSWEGYSISGRAVFMHDGASATGIYNDVNNEWILYGVHQTETRIYAGATIAARFYPNSARFRDGNISTPGITFQLDLDSGLYRNGTNDIRLSTLARWGFAVLPGSPYVFAQMPGGGSTYTVHTSGTGFFNSSSRASWKNVLGGLDDAVSELMAMEPIRYTWKPGSGDRPVNGWEPFQVERGFTADNMNEISEELATRDWLRPDGKDILRGTDMPEANRADSARPGRLDQTVPTDYRERAVLATTVAALQDVVRRLDAAGF